MAKKQQTTPTEEQKEETAFDGMVSNADGTPNLPGRDITTTGPADDADVEKALTIGSRTYVEAPEMDMEDVLVPRLRLAQGLSQEVQQGSAKPGEWVLTGSEPVAEAIIVPLKYGKLRELRDDDRDILCFSRDAKTGEGTPGGVCEVCPMNKWEDDPKSSKRIPPKCSVFYTYLCYSMTHERPLIIEFRRTALNAARQLNSVIQARGLGKFAIKVGQTANTGPKGKYYVPTISLVSSVTTEQLEDAKAKLLV